jgi:hypothetical protein
MAFETQKQVEAVISFLHSDLSQRYPLIKVQQKELRRYLRLGARYVFAAE